MSDKPYRYKDDDGAMRLKGERVVYWIGPFGVLHQVFSAPDPGTVLQLAARRALEDEKDDDDDKVDKLARTLLRWLRRLLDRDPFRQVRGVDDLRRDCGPGPELDAWDLWHEQFMGEGAIRESDDFAATGALVDELRDDGRQECATLADAIEIDARIRRDNPQTTIVGLEGLGHPWGSWGKWIGEGDMVALGSGFAYPGAYLVEVARALWFAEIKPSLPVRAVFMVEHDPSGDMVAKVDKRAGATAWAWGNTATELDGNVYGAAPGVLVPHVDLLPDDARELVKQTYLPLILERDTAADPGAVLSVPASKVLLVALASNATTAPLVEVPLGELARWLHAGVKRPQRRDLVRTARALREADRLLAMHPDGTAERCITVERFPLNPEKATADMTVRWGLGPFFKRALDELPGYLRGWFVMNLSGALRLPNEGADLRVYTLAAAEWNRSFARSYDGKYDPALTPPRTLDEIALRYFSLSTRTADYIRARKGSRSDAVRKSQQVKALRDCLDRLEGSGLVVLQRQGKALAIRPPETLLEVKATRIRRRGVRKQPMK